MKILSAEISVIVHATEDPARVSVALRNVLPTSLRDEVKIVTQRLKGHHGNPIEILETELRKRKMIDQFFDYLLEILDGEHLSYLKNNLSTQMDEDGNLYVRLNKQAAYIGEIRSKEEDPIRIKMKFAGEPANRKVTADMIKDMIENHEKVR